MGAGIPHGKVRYDLNDMTATYSEDDTVERYVGAKDGKGVCRGVGKNT